MYSFLKGYKPPEEPSPICSTSSTTKLLGLKDWVAAAKQFKSCATTGRQISSRRAKLT